MARSPKHPLGRASKRPNSRQPHTHISGARRNPNRRLPTRTALAPAAPKSPAHQPNAALHDRTSRHRARHPQPSARTRRNRADRHPHVPRPHPAGHNTRHTRPATGIRVRNHRPAAWRRCALARTPAPILALARRRNRLWLPLTCAAVQRRTSTRTPADPIQNPDNPAIHISHTAAAQKKTARNRRIHPVSNTSAASRISRMANRTSNSHRNQPTLDDNHIARHTLLQQHGARLAHGNRQLRVRRTLPPRAMGHRTRTSNSILHRAAHGAIHPPHSLCDSVPPPRRTALHTRTATLSTQYPSTHIHRTASRTRRQRHRQLKTPSPSQRRYTTDSSSSADGAGPVYLQSSSRQLAFFRPDATSIFPQIGHPCGSGRRLTANVQSGYAEQP